MGIGIRPGEEVNDPVVLSPAETEALVRLARAAPAPTICRLLEIIAAAARAGIAIWVGVIPKHMSLFAAAEVQRLIAQGDFPAADETGAIGISARRFSSIGRGGRRCRPRP